MRVGFVGVGKLGMPCALSAERYGGHEVLAWDASEEVRQSVLSREICTSEPEVEDLLTQSQMQLTRIEDMVGQADLIFVCVQTPHGPEYEGITQLPDEREDFDYSYLREAVSHICDVAREKGVIADVVIVSTVLPGTIRREILPLTEGAARIVYNPFFIAMSTVIQDFLNPEFVLLGRESDELDEKLAEFYGALHRREMVHLSIESAELVKVSYNTFIGMKIAFANLLMEICHHAGGNVDDVTDTLAKATDRIISPKYMRAGMGDGGACHPRDNIAMSHLARRLGLSFDLFEAIMKAREKQTEWLADLLIEESEKRGLPICILGSAYKPNCPLTVGSPSVLLQSMLKEKGVQFSVFDPVADVNSAPPSSPAVCLLATPHECFSTGLELPKESYVVDPWREFKPTDELPGNALGRRLYPPT